MLHQESRRTDPGQCSTTGCIGPVASQAKGLDWVLRSWGLRNWGLRSWGLRNWGSEKLGSEKLGSTYFELQGSKRRCGTYLQPPESVLHLSDAMRRFNS